MLIRVIRQRGLSLRQYLEDRAPKLFNLPYVPFPSWKPLSQVAKLARTTEELLKYKIINDSVLTALIFPDGQILVHPRGTIALYRKAGKNAFISEWKKIKKFEKRFLMFKYGA